MLCSTLYWDITTKGYWKIMLDELEMTKENFPEILEPGEVAGTILPEVADRLGLDRKVKVCTGAMDNAVGAVGVGAVRPGMFSESIGSTLAVCVPTDKIMYDPNRQMPVHYYPVKDTYMMHTFTSGGICLRWYRDHFCQLESTSAAMTGADAYDLMTMQALRAPAGAQKARCGIKSRQIFCKSQSALPVQKKPPALARRFWQERLSVCLRV